MGYIGPAARFQSIPITTRHHAKRHVRPCRRHRSRFLQRLAQRRTGGERHRDRRAACARGRGRAHLPDGRRRRRHARRDAGGGRRAPHARTCAARRAPGAKPRRACSATAARSSRRRKSSASPIPTAWPCPSPSATRAAWAKRSARCSISARAASTWRSAAAARTMAARACSSGLGLKLFDADGNELEPVPSALPKIARIDVSGLDARLKDAEFIGMSDVDNPLTGEHGATAIFGPQKGVTPSRSRTIDAALAHFADLLEPALQTHRARQSRARARRAASASRCICSARASSRARKSSRAKIGLDAALEGANWLITGEGRSDVQTLHGKAPFIACKHARAAGVEASLLSGGIDPAALAAVVGVFQRLFFASAGADHARSRDPRRRDAACERSRATDAVEVRFAVSALRGSGSVARNAKSRAYELAAFRAPPEHAAGPTPTRSASSAPISGNTTPSIVEAAAPCAHRRARRGTRRRAERALPGRRFHHITKPVTAIAASPSEIAAQTIWFASPK